MKEWFYCIYLSADDVSREYEVRYCKLEMLDDHMSNHIKFSGISVGGKAYRISPRTGKPHFNTTVCETQIPF